MNQLCRVPSFELRHVERMINDNDSLSSLKLMLFLSSRIKAEKRLKDQQRKQKVMENRKHLANVRVVQKNLVFVVGLPLRLADPDVSIYSQ